MDSTYAERYQEWERDHWWFVARRRILGALLRRTVPPHIESVLDLGCGPGGSLGLLAGHGRVTGVDLSPRLAALARRNGYVNAVASRAEQLGLKAGSFDLVVAFDMLEHVDDEMAVLAEVCRVCAPAGLLVISVPAYGFLWGEQDIVNHHRRRYTRSELGRLIERAGFSIVRLSYFNTLLFAPIAAVRLVGRVMTMASRGRTPPKSDFERARWKPADRMSETIFSMERLLVPFVNLPFGVSIVCVARRSS